MSVCPYCGGQFAPTRKTQKFCCKQHRWYFNQNKNGQAPEAQNGETQYTMRDKQICELAETGKSAEEIVESLDLTIAPSTVYGIIQRGGVLRKMREQRQADRARESEEQREKRKEERTERRIESEVSKIKEWLGSSFEYVGGYTNSNGKITLKCVRCGCVFDRSVCSLRHGQVTQCPECIKQEWASIRADTQKRWEEKRQSKREENAWKNAWKHEITAAKYARQTLLVECVECGNAFVTVDTKRTLCSEECAKRRQNRRKDKRIRRDKRIDKDISLSRLYERDNGRCWICGGVCDTEDFTERKGIKICGEAYPSIDHVIPVCDGGLDAWENVKLAHRRCNTLRYYGKYSPPVAV